VTKSSDRRAAIIELLVEHVLAEGLSASSLRPLAKAAQTSDRMLLYYFKDKAEIVAAVLERISSRMIDLIESQTSGAPEPVDQVRAKLIAISLSDEMWPYARIWLEVASLAARGDPLYRAVGGAIGRGFLAWGEGQIASETPEQRARDAARLLAEIEGMILLKSLGMDDVCALAQ